MITRTIKYTASDGTEHDSPQEAAQKDLSAAMDLIVEEGGCSGFEVHDVTEKLARNPKALRDAVNAYFEDLEEHPDVDNRICAICDGGPGNNCACTCGMKKWDEPDPKADAVAPAGHNLILTDYAKDLCATATVYDWLAQGWTHEGLIKNGMAVELEDGEIASGVRRFEMVVASGAVVPGGTAVSFTPPPLGDPDDPATWRADLPVDHPQYCRPFGTRED